MLRAQDRKHFWGST